MIQIEFNELEKLLKPRMTEKDYKEAIDILNTNYSSSARAIPIEWIRDYGPWHDAVCQANLENMIRCYESGEDYRK